MNERIKQLMLEAGYAAPELAGRAQRLAESVVADCLDQVQYLMSDTRYDDDYRRGAEISALVRARIKIQKQFGINDYE